MFRRLLAWLFRPATTEPTAKPKRRNGLRSALMRMAGRGLKSEPYAYPIAAPKLMPGVVPPGAAIATDAAPYTYAQSYGGEGGGFPGYPYLSNLATRAEYRAFAAALSTEMTREWIELTGKGDEDTDKIKAIEAELARIDLRGSVQRAVEHDCYFGRAQLLIKLRGADLELPLLLSKRTIEVGSLEGVVPVEPIWTSPNSYNANDPSAPDFYKPSSWFMLGRPVHASRMLTIITRPLPDILKPAYNFGGMSLSQLAEPYVDNWLRTRQSVSDLINNFSTTALATSMDQVLQGDDESATDLFDRAELFTLGRSNKGLMLLDKDREELVQINTPLSGLHELQAQSQEQMCAVSRMPAIVLTGISPSGLNASSAGEIRIFYDWIAAQQEAYWRQPVKTVIDVVQLSLFGEIDPDIGFTFVPLYQMTAKEQAEIRKSDCEADVAYIGAGVIAPDEARERLARDPESGYMGLDLTAEIEPLMDDTPDDEPPAQDGEFEEGNHPRAANGEFGSGGGLSFKIATPGGDVIERTLSKGDWVQPGVAGSKPGRIEGVSQARGEVKVNGLWHDGKTVEPAEAPEAPQAKKEKLSSSITKNNRKTGGGVEWSDADKVS